MTDSQPPVFLIIGAAGGVGRALSRRLIASGATVVMAGRTIDRVEAAAAELGGHAMAVDAGNFDATAELVGRVEERFGRLDGAVNLAGSILLKPAHSTSAEEWQSVIDTNLRTAFSMLRAVAPVMGRRGSGSIVLVSTAAARVGLPNHDAIAAAKAGVIGLALAAAATYAPRGVRVNVVAPGLVDTPLAARIVNHEPARRASEAMHPLGRIGEASEVASAIAWFLDAGQAWVTGQVLGVDGGLGSLRTR